MDKMIIFWFPILNTLAVFGLFSFCTKSGSVSYCDAFSTNISLNGRAAAYKFTSPLTLSAELSFPKSGRQRLSQLMSSTGADSAPSDVDDSVDMEVDVETQPESFSSVGNGASDFESAQNGLGEWEEIHGNYVLRPPNADQEPRCVVRFEICRDSKCSPLNFLLWFPEPVLMKTMFYPY